MPRPRVLVADDHAIMVQGLGRLLEGEAEIVATASDGQQLVERARQHRPDIIVSDVNMPGMSGLDAMRRLKADGLRSKFIFLTLHTDSRLASEAMRAGASGYLLKHAAAEELIEAIHAVMAGHIYLTPLMTRDVLLAIGEPDGVQSPALTPRQLDVLRLIAARQAHERNRQRVEHLGTNGRNPQAGPVTDAQSRNYSRSHQVCRPPGPGRRLTLASGNFPPAISVISTSP